MSELLAAIPRIFAAQRKDDYAHVRAGAVGPRMTERAVARTIEQMNRAYAETIQQKENDSGSRRNGG